MLIDVQIIYIRVMFNWDTALLNVLHYHTCCKQKVFLLFVLSYM